MKTTMWKRVKKQILAMVLSLAMIGTSLDVSILAFAAQTVSENSIAEKKQTVVQPERASSTHDLSAGSVTLTDACGSSCPGHVITGSYTFNKNGLYNETNVSTDYINVTGGTHNITLQDVTIDYSYCNSSGYTSIIKCCFSVAAGATANVTLTGTNTMNSGLRAPGIRVCEGGTLNILGGTGVLNVSGGGDCAGIGGARCQTDASQNHTDQTGKITIAGGTINATGGQYGAGIGTGYNVSDCDVTITGGTIRATGGDWAAGIGTGGMSYFNGPNTTGCVIKIGGGNICAVGDTANGASNVGLGKGAATAGCSLSLTNISASAPPNVYAVNLTLSGVADGTEITSISGLNSYGYSFNDFKTIGEKVCVYVPAGKTITSVTTKNGQVFTGSVTASASGEVSSIFFMDAKPVNNPTITLTDDLLLSQSGDKLIYVMGNNASGAYTGTLTIKGGTKTDCNIGIVAGAHNIVLDSVEIDLRDVTTSRKMQEGSPFYLMSGASANVTLSGTTSLIPGIWAAAVQVVSGAKVTFDGNGKLIAKNMPGYNTGVGATIGAGYEDGCGEVVINGGNFYLRNNGDGAGIGGGAINSQYAGGAVTINGGNVNVEVSKDDAQKIGYGSNGASNPEIPDSGTLKNSAGENLYLAQITLAGLNGTGGDISATGTVDYDFGGMQVMEGKLCMYLPSGETITAIKVGNQTFSGTLTTKAGETSAVFKSANIPKVSNPVVNLDANLILSKNGNDLYYQCDNVYCKYTGTITVTGNTDEYGIIVESGAHKVLLNNVSINQKFTSSGKVIDITTGATLDLVLAGKNKLQSHEDNEAIRVPSGATLKISGDGSLDVVGKPAIGCYTEALGAIIINGGTIVADGEFGSPAIGAGYVEGTGGGSITINGGTISAGAGQYSAAIGTGGASFADYNKASAISIVITGGNIYAAGSASGDCDDIGNGYGGSRTTVCDANGKVLTVTELTLSGVSEGDIVSAITLSSGAYSVTGMKVLADENSTNGKVYVYLPAGVRVTGIVVDGLTYSVPAGYAGEVLNGSHIHLWRYSASGDTLNAVCTVTGNACSSKTNTVKVVAPSAENLVYDGSEKKAYLNGNIPGQTLVITYKKLNANVWENMSGVPVMAGTYRACVTAGTYTAYVEYTIRNAVAEITELPSAETITYGQTLSQSKITGGEARNAGKVIAGSFAWEAPNEKPTVKVAANTGYKVVFTPDDINIAPVSACVKFTVNKAQIPDSKPATEMSTKFASLKYVPLPSGWMWKKEDIDRNLVAGTTTAFTAEYVAGDKDNYITTSVTVMVTKLACTHSWDSGIVTKEPTALATGIRQYTCTICKDTKSSVIKKLSMPKKGKTYTADDGLAKYKVTKASAKKGTVKYVKPVNKKSKVVVIPSTVKINGVTYKVTSVAKNAFKNNKKVRTVTIGKNVTGIGDNAFYKCTALTKITIPSKVKTIGKNAFYGCKKMTSATIGKNVSKIGSKAFYGCSKLKTLKVKTTKLTAKKIGSKAFTKTPKSMKVTVPKKKFKAYKSMLIKKGVNKKAKFKKG